ncbi:hypothetical protein ABIB57_002290 [Devosia sp. UYZn731]|uniref:SH3 domain-containing protein n=1 Tax=Devosia sp. UYZn731 TaxID=3156345 RepID=UPI0033975B3F
MNRQTRRMLLNLATGFAVAAAAALTFLPATQAAPGVITSNVNVRSGPGTNYAVVTAVPSGTQVDVQRCDSGFCYVEGRRVSGWVSAQYLSAGGRPVNPSNPGVSFGFSVGGPGGPNINIGVGNGNNGPGPRPGNNGPFPGNNGPFPGNNGPFPGNGPGPRPGDNFPGNGPGTRPPVYQDAEVCFYDRTRFRGNSECYQSGDSVRDLGRMAGSFQSMENEDGLSVQVCADRNFRDCRTYTTSASSLSSFGDVYSVRIR